MKTRSYILVTPAKNEEKTLPLLAKSIVNQSVRPKLWVIVNDNSTDGTREIVSALESRHPWIYGYEMKDEFFEYDATMRYSEVVRAGFDVARRISHESAIPYGYIALVDSDFILERRFFEKLILAFHERPSLGIASGGVYLKSSNGKKIIWERTNPKHPRGSPRVFRRECFDDIGGYRRFYTPDVVSNYLARIKGWDVAQIIDAIAVQLRPTQSRGGVRASYKKQGIANYCLGVPPESALLRVLFFVFTGAPLSKALGFFEGYFLEKKSDCSVPRPVFEFTQRDMSVLKNILKTISMWGMG